MTQIIEKTVKGRECRFAVHLKPPQEGAADLHFVKENTHYEDGTTSPTVRLIKNYQRSYWITKKGRRDHTQKKEYCDIQDLIEYKTTQSNLVSSAAKALGTPWFQGNLRMLSESPYLYGTDIPSTALLKKDYENKYPDLKTPYTFAVLDTETDVVNGTEEIIMVTLSMCSRVFTAVVKSFFDGHVGVREKIDLAMTKYLNGYVEKRHIVSDLYFASSPVDAIIACMQVAHELKPDFLTFWNIDFDVTKMLNAIEKEGANAADIFCDPIVPPEYRMFDYKRGKSQKVTASGLVTPIKPAARWHVVTCPCSFTFIDSMCVYKQIRTGKQEEPSYALNAILEKHLGIRKLEFDEASHLSKLDWHVFMQTYYKVEYTIYNRFDCIGVEELQEKINDLAITLPMFAGVSDFAIFNSQPKRLVERLHFYALQSGKVMGSSCSKMEDEFDKMTYGLEDWIN